MNNSNFLRLRATFAKKAAAKKNETNQPVDPLGISKSSNLGGSFRQNENVKFVDLDAGGICDICTTRPKTHFVVPCGHSACLICWTNWLFQDDEFYQGQTTLSNLKAANVRFTKKQTCFVCQSAVKTIKRYAYDVVPRHPYEEEELVTPSGRKREADERSFKFYEVKIDASYEALMKQVVAVKDELTVNILGKLEEVESHILEFDVNGVGNEERSIVLSVDSIAVNEAFVNLEELLTRSHWRKMVSAIDDYVGVLVNFEIMVDEYVPPGKDDEEDENSNGLEKEEEIELTTKCLGEIRKTLELSVSETSLLAQWERVSKMIDKMGYDQYLLSNIISKISAANIEGTLNKKFLQETITKGIKRKVSIGKELTRLTKTTIPNLINKVVHTIEDTNKS